MAFVVCRAARSASRTTFSRHTPKVLLQSFSSMTNQGIPVVMIGRTSGVGQTVVDALKPEYEGEVVLYTRFTRNPTHSDNR
jgi:hypothetical protein